LEQEQKMAKTYYLEVEYDDKRRGYGSQLNSHKRLNPGIDYDSLAAAMAALRLHAEASRKKVFSSGRYKAVVLGSGYPASANSLFLHADDTLLMVFTSREVTPEQLALGLAKSKRKQKA
jgi:hypothetical protein